MKKACNIVLILALVLGIIASAFCLKGRVDREEENRDVTVVMSAHDVLTMAAFGNGSAQDMYEELKDAGIKYVEKTGDFFFLTPETDGAAVHLGVEEGKTLILTENGSQTGADLTSSARDAILELRPECLKCFYLADKYAARYNYLGTGGTREIEDILFRAVTDRNVRVIFLAPFMDGERMVTDTGEYITVVENLRARLQRQNITVNGESAGAGWYEPPMALIVMASLAVCAGGVLGLRTIIRKGNVWQITVLAGAFAACGAGLYLRENLMLHVLALGAAVLMPCLGVMVLASGLRRARLTSRVSLARELGVFIVTLVPAVGCSLMGGVLVGALLGSTEYMLELDMFSGVKLSQLLPLVYSVYIIWLAVYHETGRSPRGDISAAWQSFRRDGRVKIIVIALVVAAVVVIFILRTGDGMLSAGAFELKFRSWLERTLYARPRTKEMLIAWPCAGAAAVCALRGWKNALLPLGVLVTVGLTGVCNTFCHIRADFFLSLSRTFIALGIGIVLGFIVVCVLHIIARGTEKRREI